MKFLLTTLTFWCLLVFAILVGLQWFPITGVFLMMLAAPFWVGYMPHVIAIALFLDILQKKAHKILLLLPIAPYVIYYGFFIVELNKIAIIENELIQQNPSQIIEYDPELHSLVMGANMVKQYKIPVSYSSNSNFPEGYLSHRIVTQELCKKGKGLKHFTHTFGVSWSSYGKNRFYKRFPNVCHFRIPEKPQHTLLKVNSSEEKNPENKLHKTHYKFYLGEEYLGQYTSASYAALPPFPQFIIGCALNSAAPSWDCFHQLRRTKKILQTFPEKERDSQHYAAVMRLLKIEKYTEEELKDFKDYPYTLNTLGKLIEQKENEKQQDLDQWGLRKDSLYQPTIGNQDGYPSFEGVVYHRNKGGPFKEFIKQHEGEIVYLDIQAKPNARTHGFTNYGVCKVGKKCNGRTDNSYQFKNKDGKRHSFKEEGKFKGFFLVGEEKLFENKGDNDTITPLTIVPPEKLAAPESE